ncbi:complement component C1q receptor [Poeciliopsis prolifica]|uniref:complement component C1q receptor n=1 Tax=Poeciliopsis prolifica TaxID=188132 RepID=UPI002413AAE3|nr:complement component C1q receptor [Poeciliopsis prolifica]
MLLIFLLLLISSLGGSSAAKQEMLCTPKACFVLNMEPVGFQKAQNRCEDDGGYLMTLRDRKEEEDLRSLLLLVEKQRPDPTLKVWIGLKLKKQDCVLPGRPLRGFKWVSGDEESLYSNWEQEPPFTCTLERCVRVVYTFSDQEPLKWTQGVCSKKASYACKFYFQGMCSPLVLQGPGKIVYESIFVKEPLKTELKLLPYGTRARIFCGGHETTSSQCRNLDGAYAWSPPGPFCKQETQNCQKNNGGCAQKCRQDGGTVRCSCREGWELEKDGFSCRMTDLCRPDTCEHSCVMSEDGVSCRCPSGFKLSENQRNCSDVDECLSQACDYGSCVNTVGSYRCVCGDGFRLTDGECRHVNECGGLVCEHGCVNSGGTFSCLCQDGFRESGDGPFGDGPSCVDVDECAGDPCPRLLTCINTIGSFSCLKPETQESTTFVSTRQPVSSAAPAEDRRTHRTAVELQRQSPHTDAPLPELVNVTDQLRNQSPVSAEDASAGNRVLICVLGSVVPLLALVALTLFIAIFRCSRSKTEVKKKKTTADGYCWVSSGLDPRLEKLYESILTDDP